MSSIASYPINSMLFGGTSPFVNYVAATVPAVGSSPATYEWWLYATARGTNSVLLNTRTNGNTFGTGLVFTMNGNGTGNYWLLGDNSVVTYPIATLNTWNHIAITMPSGVINSVATFWLNGVSQGTTVVDAPQTSTDLAIGGRVYGGIGGNISNFRYVRGVEVYTGTFTPPRQRLTDTQGAGTNISAITAGQTQLLLNTFGSYLKDSSSYARTVTASGSVMGSSLNPFS
jgi:hypothetical protein